jgi:hypothetical protein
MKKNFASSQNMTAPVIPFSTVEPPPLPDQPYDRKQGKGKARIPNHGTKERKSEVTGGRASARKAGRNREEQDMRDCRLVGGRRKKSCSGADAQHRHRKNNPEMTRQERIMQRKWFVLFLKKL